jgi:crossover junction endodeoxyribonuclease RusA
MEISEHQPQCAFEIPWPDRKLSPNARVHWSAKQKIGKAYKEYCYVLARQAMIAAKTYDYGEKVSLDIKFYPKDRRRRDLDNCVASIKYALDGIAQAISIDDSNFKLTISIEEELKNIITIQING